jgi:hypothetical protein
MHSTQEDSLTLKKMMTLNLWMFNKRKPKLQQKIDLSKPFLTKIISTQHTITTTPKRNEEAVPSTSSPMDATPIVNRNPKVL